MVDVTILGCGNLGSALITGLAKEGNHDVTAYDIDESALDRVEPYCQQTTTDIEEAATSDVIVVAVKPDIVETVLDSLDLSADQTLVTVAAGVPIDFVDARTDATVVRIMPNLAAETADMAAAVTWDEVDEDVRALLDDLGEFVEIDEERMDVATALNGSGPAFVFYFLQAMKRAAVEEGLESDDAEVLAAQTVKGAAETVLRSDRSVDELIDAVCSPKGTTIEGMEVLWDSDLEAEVEEALSAAARRSRELAEEFEHD
ncbi:pyrroline-5-carboxylate reductase [Halopenitus sp. H-Gu1]|uniref:pyrroline-5-carboxylate reductase n=1 Tax=Halopenitus sp. H-Gu1 TaxID=3242697 RepID=UPI00359CD513